MINLSLRVQSATKTHPGHVRTVNEDSVYENCQRGLWAVADGMGGYAAGDVASKTVVMALSELSLAESLEESIELVKQAIYKANQKLLFELTLPPNCKQIGSTVAVLLFNRKENRCACLWVGDSRLYALRNNELYQLTKDHSLVQEMVDDGLLDPNHRDSHPQSHVITRAVGVSDDLEVDVMTFSPEPGDIYFLCSDGLYNEINCEQILACITRESTSYHHSTLSCERIANRLVEEVLKTKASDNVSVNVISLS